jgi:hypothetical protein
MRIDSDIGFKMASRGPRAHIASQRRLRAMIEIIDGELKVYPIADTDEDERLIFDALRFAREEFAER